MALELSSPTLDFLTPLRKNQKQVIVLENRNDFTVAYKIKTNRQNRYITHPHKGTITAGDKVEISVSIATHHDLPDPAYKDKFLIESFEMSFDAEDGVIDDWVFAELLDLASKQDHLHSRKVKVRILHGQSTGEGSYWNGMVSAISSSPSRLWRTERHIITNPPSPVESSSGVFKAVVTAAAGLSMLFIYMRYGKLA